MNSRSKRSVNKVWAQALFFILCLASIPVSAQSGCSTSITDRDSTVNMQRKLDCQWKFRADLLFMLNHYGQAQEKLAFCVRQLDVKKDTREDAAQKLACLVADVNRLHKRQTAIDLAIQHVNESPDAARRREWSRAIDEGRDPGVFEDDKSPAERKPIKRTSPFPAGGIRDCERCPELIAVKSGTIVMETDDKAKPRIVKVQGFYIGKTEVTQAQWAAVMGKNPSAYENCGADCPVENVTWYEAQEYVRKLSLITGKVYRLPTEAEWRFACQAGKTKYRFCGGDDLDRVAWYSMGSSGNSSQATHPVADKQPNAWGIYDMTGNADEWIQDCFNGTAFSSEVPTDGSASQWDGCTDRVVIGGSSLKVPTDIGSRNGVNANEKVESVGLRVVRGGKFEVVDYSAESERVKRATETAEGEKVEKVRREKADLENQARIACAKTDVNAVDPSGWALFDNCEDINWERANKYCADKGDGWRLPTIKELRSIATRDRDTICGPTFSDGSKSLCYVDKKIRLTASSVWSIEPKSDERKEIAAFTYYTNEIEFLSPDGEDGVRALCIRRP